MDLPNRIGRVDISTKVAGRNVGRRNQNWGIMVVQEAASVMYSESEDLSIAEEVQTEEKKDSKALRVIGWFSVGMAVAALGIYLGIELRSRSKFKKRTPYDFYANAGESQASEFGVGI
jgi:hypothetical protein